MYSSKNYYYFLKAFMPRRLQIYLRRTLINRKILLNKNIWPIDKTAATPPEDWQGWPDGKKFALVLTHDVETEKGLNKCHELMDIDEKFGFRSSFNFVTGDYQIPEELLNELQTRGFEIGIHGLHHDGNIFRSRKVFAEHAALINQTLKKWNAAGFRSPSMYHNLDWLHDLNIKYDASTFDTDPFEPQPDGMGTIFPFWVEGKNGKRGYVELPYTLPQDFLLFILMQHENIDIWKTKLDWIVKQGGMALLITHPDYINFANNKLKENEYPVKYYAEFLQHIKTKYEGQYWQPLPKDIARFWANNYKEEKILDHRKIKLKKKKIWIDLDNTPHIPFFKPIIDELNKRGYECVVTARDAYQVLDLADRYGLKYKKIGHHYGKNKLLKVLGTLIRSLELLPFVIKNKPAVAVSHGSRTQLIASRLSGVPSLVLIDYEHAQGLVIINPNYVMVPDVIPTSSFKISQERVSQYPGIKEDIYVVSYTPNPSIINELKIDERKIVITIRPPATEAHYFCQESEELFEASMRYLLQKEEIQLILLPRNKRQEEFVREIWASAVESERIIIPDHAVNGLDLMWYSDLVISGGGTMNREAAALGVPVYSIFRGALGAVDHYLSQQGRLIMLEKPADLQSKIKLVRRNKNRALEHSDKAALNAIVDKIEQIHAERSK
jgi:predicted glycosyltransferase/peptidoglycan/xylan/chitin deacetylase (PgdA/CDA1 family)